MVFSKHKSDLFMSFYLLQYYPKDNTCRLEMMSCVEIKKLKILVTVFLINDRGTKNKLNISLSTIY